MNPYLKRSISLILCMYIALALSSCAKTSEGESTTSVQLTQENVTQTVELVTKALQEMDVETLKKCVDSTTLKYIISYASEHEQIAQLGQAMFENLTIKVRNIDLENKEVTVSVRNKDLREVADKYVQRLNITFKDTAGIISGLNDETFLDASLRLLKGQIADAIMTDNPEEVTLGVRARGENVVLVFDEKAEDAVSGGALTTVKNAFTKQKTTENPSE